ncbi:MAG: helix-turn-helix domain-containing protein [Candidatus Cryptobacteroides sp.]
MAEPYYEIDIAQLAQMTGVAGVTEMSNDFIITRISGKDAFSLLQYPVRLNAYAAIYCTVGHFDIDINVTTYRVSQDTMLLYVPGSTLHLRESELDNLMVSEAVFVACTRDFMNGGHINFNGLFEKSVRLLSSPCIEISEEGKKILTDYYTLVSDLYNTSLEGTENAIGSIGTSLMCLLGNLWKDEVSRQLTSKNSQSRAQVKYDEFLALVSKNFMTEKSVAFYAEKMCMTPKYLTTLVKNASGRTATEWIDAFLVLEAKNLLKYSDLTVKEIGYRLNFQSIPSFHKFFKNQTGLTPAEYRKAK